jgi:excisionase family DNA binding protein
LTPLIDRLITERVEQKRPLLLSVSQIAEELSCSRASVFGLIHGGHLEAVRIGRSYRVATATLQDYVDELTKPAYQRQVITARSAPVRVNRRHETAEGDHRRQSPVPSVIPATRPPRAPRPKPTKVATKEIAESRCTVAELAERWWGQQSATEVVERAGVELVTDPEGRETFRYGDLTEWAESNPGEFERWCQDFDPLLRRRNSADESL